MADTQTDIPVLKPGVKLETPNHAQPNIDDVGRKLYADTLPKTVQITTDTGAGSGFFMDKDGRVGTAAHVILGTREQFITTSDGTKYKARIEKLDDINDTAILKPMGLEPGSRPVAEMGSSQNLKNDQPIYPVGHPFGLRPAYISPGTFVSQLTQAELFHQLDPTADKDLEEGLKGVTPKELDDVKAALARQLLSGTVQIQPGDSGGPMFDVNGKVLGVNDMITGPTKGFFVPVEKIRDLYNGDGNFKYTYNYVAEPWAQNFKNTLEQKPLIAGAELASAAGIGATALTVMSRFPRSAGVGSSLYEAANFLSDSSDYLSSTDSHDKMRFGVKSLSDVLGTVSSLALLSSRYRIGGAVGLALGISGRIAADFIPTHLIVTDIERKADPLIPPRSPDVQKTLSLG